MVMGVTVPGPSTARPGRGLPLRHHNRGNQNHGILDIGVVTHQKAAGKCPARPIRYPNDLLR